MENCAAGFTMMLDSTVKLYAWAVVAENFWRTEDKKVASPPKKNKGEIEASPAKITKNKKAKNCGKVHKLFGLLGRAKEMGEEEKEILIKCGDEDLFRSNWSDQWHMIMRLLD